MRRGRAHRRGGGGAGLGEYGGWGRFASTLVEEGAGGEGGCGGGCSGGGEEAAAGDTKRTLSVHRCPRTGVLSDSTVGVDSANCLGLGLPDHLDEHLPCLLWVGYLTEEVDASTFHAFNRLQAKREAEALD